MEKRGVFGDDFFNKVCFIAMRRTRSIMMVHILFNPFS